MIPTTFNYHKASSVEEAVALLAEHGDDAKILGGGHSLIPAMKLRLNQPTTLIAIGRMESLRYIKMDGSDLVIGASTTHHEINTSDLVRNHLAMLADGAGHIGDVQVRNMGTLCGSIAHADPAADWPALLVAADASIRMQGGKGSRTVSAEDFFTGFYETVLEESEIITEVRVPKPATGTVSAYAKFVQPASRFAIVGCAVILTMSDGKCKNARVAFTGVSEYVFRDSTIENALNGQEINASTIKNATAKVADGRSILSDHFASEEYRQHLAGVYAKRALMAVSYNTG